VSFLFPHLVAVVYAVLVSIKIESHFFSYDGAVS
jgi:hypothetical protein